ncbi:hypothetical protein AF335_28140 [Streptomyces eurocidicus]|uniref:Uncharacterized protein n=1 Tax=Streptomyces eurocidicus TaxID=66423 RepID=A0A2N8NPH4_STREU|nr:hypothetical protein [Streptomyces eurocidicus]PNE30671.1 hypothetical protein AF335_28140 [Streptomyces eurocidicus]
MTHKADGYPIGAPVVDTRGSVVAVTRERDVNLRRYWVRSALTGREWWAQADDLRPATAEEREESGTQKGGHTSDQPPYTATSEDHHQHD